MKAVLTPALRGFCTAPGFVAAILSVVSLHLFIPFAAAQATARLVKDITPGTETTAESSWPSGFVRMGSHIYFAAAGPHHGRELWKTDGTAPGTVLVRDVSRVAVPSSTLSSWSAAPWSSWPMNLTVSGSTLYFTTNDRPTSSFGGHPVGAALWKSDGTEAGTVLVRQLTTETLISGGSLARDLTPVGTKLFFCSPTSTATVGLWVSDGTEAGTVILKDDVGVPMASAGWLEWPHSLASLRQCVAAGSTLYFSVKNSGLWKTDGTPAGTIQVKSPTSSSDYLRHLTVLGDRLFFVWNEGGPNALWTSDGTESGTVPIAENVSQVPVVALGNAVYFSADFGPYTGLWRTTGLPGGTVRIGVDSDPGRTLSQVRGMVRVGEALYLRGGSSATGYDVLWKSDGTDAGTLPVLKPGNQPVSTVGTSAMIPGETLLYLTIEQSTTHHLWRSDGTGAGTYVLTSSALGVGNPNPNHPSPIVATDGDLLYFCGTDRPGVTSGDRNGELYVTDGTVAGTRLIRDITRRANGAGITAIQPMGNSACFFRQTGNGNSRELWTSDGTADGTSLVADVPSTVVPLFLGETGNGHVLFSASPPSGTPGVYRADGTPGSANLLAAVAVTDRLGTVGSSVYFAGETAGTGAELWKTDGTPEGTVMVLDIAPGTSSSSPSQFARLGSRFLFTATTAATGRELWISDGTPAGTTLLSDIRSGNASSDLRALTAGASVVYFDAYDGVTARSVWKTNGTPAGTVPVPGTTSMLNGMIIRDDLLVYIPADGDYQSTFQVTDGTAAGSMLLKQLPSPVRIPRLTGTHAGVGYLSWNSPEHGYELGRTDGTPAGTVLVDDHVPGPPGSDPTGAHGLATDGAILLSMGTTEHGYELHTVRNGEIRLVHDIAPGSASSSPSLVTRAGSRFFLTATDDTGSETSRGRELWVLEPDNYTAAPDWTLY